MVTEKINSQNRDKLSFFFNMSTNKFTEAPHSIGCKIPLGTVHCILKAITIGWSQFQSASNKPLKFGILAVWVTCYWYPFDKRPDS